MIFNKNKQKGVTLIELLVTMSVLVVGISGSMALIHRTIEASSVNTAQLQAAYLAQEGIEIVRNIRDANYVNGYSWDTGISSGDCYEISYNLNTMSSCLAGLRFLKIDNNGFYQYLNGNDSKFTRQIKITKWTNSARIEAIVSWQEKNETYNVTVTANLYDWR